ncbi:hypothetical protein C8R44DRAFT_761606 [Mycena epipterygia]|nr:hypothetical protein C8R44DRAFT_761606 [Mycena epipterygia]
MCTAPPAPTCNALIFNPPAGSSGGFESCLVKSVLARGDRVIATVRSVDKMQDLPKTEDVRLLQLDITAGEQAIKGIIATAVAFWGRIDVLVNNAGYGAKALVEEGAIAEMRLQYETNVFGTLNVTTAVLPYMRAGRSGTVVMIGRLYASSKAAVRAFSETLATELAPFSICMLIVEPAAFRTNALISNSVYTGNAIPDYDAMRDAAIARRPREDAMEAVADVVRGEAKAAGKPWPLFLILGDLGVSGVTEKIWKEVSTGLDIDPEHKRSTF